MIKSLKGIPKNTLYCYSGSCAPGSKTFKICPYWSNADDRPYQENGYCQYLGKGDYEINREPQTCNVTQSLGNGKYKYIVVEHGVNNPSWFSLLWDMCKDPDCPRYDEKNETQLLKNVTK